MIEDWGRGPVDKGPRIMNSFDAVSKRGAFVQDIRVKPLFEEKEYKPMGYNRLASEEPYLESLRAFFARKVEQLTATDRQHIERIMQGDERSFAEVAVETGVTRQAVQQATSRALSALRKVITGGQDDEAAVARELHFVMKVDEGLDGRDRVGHLPEFVKRRLK